MASKDIPTPDYLRQLLRYEPETGRLFWRERPAEFFAVSARPSGDAAKGWNSRWAGKEAFTATSSTGHLHGSVDHALYKAHRVAWAIHYGEWPSGMIDHINHNPADNRIHNLRDVPQIENERNQPLRRGNKFGAHGISQKGASRWRARIRHEGELIHLGYFNSVEAAVAARKAAEAKYGFHPNHGT